MSREAAVDAEQGVLLLGSQALVEPDRLLDRRRSSLIVQQAGARVQLLRRDLECVGDPLQHLPRRLVEPALDLTEVCVGDVRELAKVPQRQVRDLALEADELSEGLGHRSILPSAWHTKQADAAV